MVKIFALSGRRLKACMSDPAWRAVLVHPNHVTVWDVSAAGDTAPPTELPHTDLAALTGPLIIAGLDLPGQPVPTKPRMDTTYVPDLPQAAAIRPLSQDRPAALTRGSETAIAGYLAQNPSFDGVLLVLGGETCWAHISAEEVVSFQTFLTPELTTVLTNTSADTSDAFQTALSETMARPERLAQHLASARAGKTLQEAAHLIGAEIAAAKPYWLGQRVVILGDPTSAAPYLATLEAQGVPTEQSDLNTAFLTGFKAAWAQIAP